MTLTLAIIGAVTGVVGMLLDAARYIFDRPRLVVGFHVSRSIPDPAVIGIDVTNRGRRPTTILKAAFKSDGEAEFRDPDGGAVIGTGAVEITLSDEPTVVAAHGGVQQFRSSLTAWPGPFHADEPLRAYVIDSYKNRPTWGPAPAILRMLLRNRVEAVKRSCREPRTRSAPDACGASRAALEALEAEGASEAADSVPTGNGGHGRRGIALRRSTRRDG